MATGKAKEAQDQSMEEILQSIKRIIAEEGEPVKDGTAPAAPEKKANGMVKDSDILELTDMVEPGSEMAVAKEASAEPEAPGETPQAESPAGDTAASQPDPIDALLEEMGASVQPEPEPEPMPEPEPQPAMKAAPEPAGKGDVLSDIDSLLSTEAAKKSASAFRSLAEASQPRAMHGASLLMRDGTTIEDLVIEAMQPILREWLDTNLPAMVERLVDKEIRKLSGNF